MKLRWLLYGVGGFFITVFLVLVLAFALVQTTWGKNVLSTRLSSMLSSPPEQTILLEGLEGFLPFEIRLKRFTLGDVEGDWLMVEDLTLRWSPAALLSGKLRVKEISASRIELDRGPLSVEEDKEPEEPRAPPRLPSRLSALVVEKIAIPQLILGERLLGHAAVFSIDGGLTPGEERHDISAALVIERIDPGPKTVLNMLATLHAESSKLGLRVTFDEDPDGWIASVAGLEDAGPLHARMEGDGPLQQWRGDYRLEAGRYASAQGDLKLEWARTITASLHGSLETAPDLIPDEWKPILGPKASFTFDLHSDPGISVALDHGRIETAGFFLEGTGKYVYDSQAVQGSVNLLVPSLSVLEHLLEESLQGELSLSARIDGTVGAPSGDAALEVKQLVFGNVTASLLETELQLASKAVKRGTASLFDVSGRGSARQIVHLSRETMPEGNFTWSLKGEVPREGAVTLERLEVRGEQNFMEVSGNFNPQTLESALLSVGEFQDLRDFQVLTGMDHSGTASFRMELNSEKDLKKASARLEGAAQNLAGLPPQISSLVGSRMDLSGMVDLRDKELLDLTGFRLHSDGFSLEAQGHLNMADQSLRGDLDLLLPDLQVLSEALGRPVEGKAAMKAQATGLLSDLQVLVDLEGDRVVVDGETFEKIQSEFRGMGFPERARGDFLVHVHKKGSERLSLLTDYVQEGEKLYLNNFRLTGPGTQVEGDVIFNFANTLVDGTLAGKFEDLAALGQFMGTELKGTAQFDALLREREGRQDLSLQLKGDGIEGTFGQLEAVSLNADLQDVLDNPRGDARAALRGFSTPGLDLHEFSLTAEGNGQSLRFETGGKGHARSPFDVAARGELLRAMDEERLLLTTLRGTYDAHPFQLQSPLSISRKGDAVALSSLDLRVGEARLAGDGFLDSNRVNVEAELSALPLNLLADFGVPDLSGEAHASLAIRGDPSVPRADLNLRLENVRSLSPQFREVPPTLVTAEANVAGNRLESRLRIEGPFPEPATAHMAFPLRLSLVPLDVQVPPGSPLEGSFTAKADLHALMSLYPQEDHRVRGILNADLQLSGSMEDPQLSGQMALADGYYENWATGTVLDRITLRMVARENRLEIEELRATDGQRGTLEGEGSVLLEPAQNFPLEVALRMSDATLVRRDDFTGTLGGSLNLSGTTDQILLGGDLILAPAEIDIGRPMAPAVTRLDVIEINETDLAEDLPQVNGEAAPMAVDLNVTVRMPNRVFVRGSGLDSEWQGNLRVQGSAAEPSILGNLESVRGHFDFLDTRFQITRGIISLDGMHPPSPRVDIIAEATGKDVLARLIVTGFATSPQIALESDPSLPQDEILARLLFGRNLSQITPMQGIRLARAARSLLGNNGEPGIMERTRRILGVDRLEVREGLEADAPAAIGIGKYLSEDIYVDIQRDIGGQGGRARVEVEITPNISLEGQAGSDASTGLGINWKYDY